MEGHGSVTLTHTQNAKYQVQITVNLDHASGPTVTVKAC